MFGHDIIVVGASAGGVDALPKLIKHWKAKAKEHEKHAEMIRQLLQSHQ